jgi:GDP-D-mannose 3',5'-epimerase
LNEEAILRDWESKTVLVTGGAGFIGSTLTKTLVDLGAKVVVADNLSRGKIANLGVYFERIDFRQVDLTDIANCVDVSKGVDYIFHLASAVGGVQYIFKHNVENLTSPSIMNLSMLEAARINDVKGYLFASSACVYRSAGDSINKFKEEDAYPANPPTTYGWAKILGEIGCRAYNKDYGIKACAVRIFNVYGEYESLDTKSAHVIPSLIRKAILYPEEDFSIFGDGNQERAFLYIQDCVEGFLEAIKKCTKGEAINLGTQEVISIEEVAKKIIALSKKRIEVKHDLNGPRGVNRYYADMTKTHKLLDWSPKVPLDEGLARTYKWAAEQLMPATQYIMQSSKVSKSR